MAQHHDELEALAQLVDRIFEAAEAFRACLPLEDGFAATAEMLLAALRSRRRVVEVPSTLRARTEGASKMRLGTTALRHLRLLLGGGRTRTAPTKRATSAAGTGSMTNGSPTDVQAVR